MAKAKKLTIKYSEGRMCVHSKHSSWSYKCPVATMYIDNKKVSKSIGMDAINADVLWQYLVVNYPASIVNADKCRDTEKYFDKGIKILEKVTGSKFKEIKRDKKSIELVNTNY